jgi:hypothetical protein
MPSQKLEDITYNVVEARNLCNLHVSDSPKSRLFSKVYSRAKIEVIYGSCSRITPEQTLSTNFTYLLVANYLRVRLFVLSDICLRSVTC